MDDALVTLINILFYIFIFRFIAGLFRRKKPQGQSEETSSQTSEQPVQAERKRKPKKKESFIEEALQQLKKLEQLAEKKPQKKVKKPRQEPLPVVEAPIARHRMQSQVVSQTKENDEKNLGIYYNKGVSETKTSDESQYLLRSGDLKKAIVYAEIIGPPVSKKPGIPVRR